ncbi:hypothetical protein RchiOBHm_Chr4g0413711 [Rosa chinensis]|uniref:Uncharacterized protein n=1 Tax=Rosa chinensis TaxID=74649 RepID=A0A2P6QW87_ROSCH|nr:hypothetical protein RchiOBHm_Chr4g0413711 [Rosa chinensis]
MIRLEIWANPGLLIGLCWAKRLFLYLFFRFDTPIASAAFKSGLHLCSTEAPQFDSEFSCRSRRKRSNISEQTHLFERSLRKS